MIYLDRLFAWMEAHPQIAGVLMVTIGWPILTGGLSFFEAQISKRAPVAMDLLRRLGFDAKGVLRLLSDLLAKRTGVRVNPEALEVGKMRPTLPSMPAHWALVTDRGEIIASPDTVPASRDVREVVTAEPKGGDDEPRDPPAMGGVPRGLVTALATMLVCVVVASLTACTRTEQVQAANAQREIGHGTARTLGELCDFKAADAMPDAEARAYTLSLRQRGCDVAWEAQTAFAKAHAAQVAAIDAAEKGECMIGTPRSAPPCDLLGVATKTYTAGRALADSVAAVQGAVKAAGAK